MFFRASIFCAASSIEAFINFIGDTFKQGNTLDKNELAFLNDKILEVSTSKAIIEEKVKFNPVDGKLKFIINRFGVPLDISSSNEWSNFQEFKALRDSLVHSKVLSDEKTITEYKISIKKGLNSNIDIMSIISTKLFGKTLRQNLLDLKI